MKKLLALINNPKESKKFIRYVSSLASDLHAHVYLLYVQDPNSYPLGIHGTTGVVASQISSNIENNAKIANKILEQTIEELKKELPDNVFIDKMVKIGITINIIKDFIAQNKTNMIVLEGKDNSNWLEVSSNMGIVENVDCPVWIIPKGSKYKSFKEIMYATDYLEADVPTLKKLVYLTHSFLPKITALHITESLDFEESLKKVGFQDRVRKDTAYDNLEVKAISAVGNTNRAELINDYASLAKSDLIVALKENQNFLQSIFKTSDSEKIIKKSDLPILVYHENS